MSRPETGSVLIYQGGKMASLRLVLCFVGMSLIGDTDAHGRLMMPCQRGSLWRCYDQNQFASNFDDMGNFCGGTQVRKLFDFIDELIFCLLGN